MAAELSRLRRLLGMAVDALGDTNGPYDASFIDALHEGAGMPLLGVTATPGA